MLQFFFLNLGFFLRIRKIPGSNQGGDTASQVLPCRATWCGVPLRIRDHYCPKRCTELGQIIILYIAGLRFFISVSLILHHALHPSPVSHPSSCYIFISPGSMQSHWAVIYELLNKWKSRRQISDHKTQWWKAGKLFLTSTQGWINKWTNVAGEPLQQHWGLTTGWKQLGVVMD